MMRTFENALQSAKIWKRNSIGFVWTGRIHANLWKRLHGHVISASFHLHSKNKDGEYRQRTYCCFYCYLAPIRLDCELAAESFINFNSAFYTCAVKGSKRFQSFSSFSYGRVKRSENDHVTAILSLRFRWNEKANFWKCTRVNGALNKMNSRAIRTRPCTVICLGFNFSYTLLQWIFATT